MAGAEQRQLRHLPGQGQRQFNPRRAAAENRQGLWCGLPALPTCKKLGKGFDRQRLHGVALLGRCANLGTDIQRQPAGIEGASVGQLHLLLGGGQAFHRADDQLDLGRATQRLQFDLAIRRAVSPSQQPRQHARVPGHRPGAEQGNAPRWSFDQRPAPQHAEVGVAGAEQQEVVVMVQTQASMAQNDVPLCYGLVLSSVRGCCSSGVAK